MNISYEYRLTPFMRSFLRLDNSEPEDKKAQTACFWLLSHLNQLLPYFRPADQQLLQIIYDTHWQSRHDSDDFGSTSDGVTLSLDMLEDKASEFAVPGVMERILEIREGAEDEDENYPGRNGYHTTDDLDVSLQILSDGWKSDYWHNLSGVLRAISSGTYKNPANKHLYTGAAGCRTFLYEQMEKGLLDDVKVLRNLTYLLAEQKDTLINAYEDEEGLTHTLLTGLPSLDEAFQLKRGQLFGVLGYNKYRKTTMCRSIVYNMIQDGLSVIWIALEQTAEEELTALQVLHAHRLFPQTTLSVQKVDRHKLTKLEKEQFAQAGQKFNQIAGSLKIVEPGSRSWSQIRQIIETEAILQPYDVICIDYLTLAQSTNKDTRAGMAEIIMDAKQLAKNQNALFITPIQANREGANSAAGIGWPHSKDELTSVMGCYNKEGIDTYSEYAKSCDCIITLFYDEENCQKKHQIIIGLLLCRRAGPMHPLIAKVDDNAGYIFETDYSFDDEEVR